MIKPNHPVDKQFINPVCHWKYDGQFTVRVLADAIKSVRGMLPPKASMKGDTFSINATVESSTTGITVITKNGAFVIAYTKVIEIRNMVKGPLWIQPKS